MHDRHDDGVRWVAPYELTNRRSGLMRVYCDQFWLVNEIGDVLMLDDAAEPVCTPDREYAEALLWLFPDAKRVHRLRIAYLPVVNDPPLSALLPVPGLNDVANRMLTRPRCACGKVRARDVAEAQQFAHEVARHHHQTTPEQDANHPIWFYVCRESGPRTPVWHWTRHPDRKHAGWLPLTQGYHAQIGAGTHVTVTADRVTSAAAHAARTLGLPEDEALLHLYAAALIDSLNIETLPAHRTKESTVTTSTAAKNLLGGTR